MLSCGHSGVIHIKYRIFLISRRISILRFGARLSPATIGRSRLIRLTFDINTRDVVERGSAGGYSGKGEGLKLHNLHYEITFLLFYFSQFPFALSFFLSPSPSSSVSFSFLLLLYFSLATKHSLDATAAARMGLGRVLGLESGGLAGLGLSRVLCQVAYGTQSIKFCIAKGATVRNQHQF